MLLFYVITEKLNGLKPANAQLSDAFQKEGIWTRLEPLVDLVGDLVGVVEM